MIFQELIDRAAPDKGIIWQYVADHMRAGVVEKIKDPATGKQVVSDAAANATIISSLQGMLEDKYHPFLLPVAQATEFLFSKIETDDAEYFFKMKMPFDNVFLDFHGTLRLDGENIKGIALSRFKAAGHTPEMARLVKENHGDLNVFFVWAITDKFMQGVHERYPYYKLSRDGKEAWAFKDFHDKIPSLASLISNKCPCLVIADSDQGTAESVKSQFSEEEKSLSEALRKIAIGFCLYVNSVNVEVVRVEGELSKKRIKQGKRVPEAYYKCKLETKSVTLEEPRGDGRSHGYQYDVRGHFKHFKKGRMKGKTLWCPPHRRGLANEVYRPKTYHLTQTT